MSVRGLHFLPQTILGTRKAKARASHRPPKPSQHLPVKQGARKKKKTVTANVSQVENSPLGTSRYFLPPCPPPTLWSALTNTKAVFSCLWPLVALPAGSLRCPLYYLQLENELQSFSRFSKGTTGYSWLPLFFSHHFMGKEWNTSPRGVSH